MNSLEPPAAAALVTEPAISSSWPMAPAGTPLPKPTTSIRRTSSSCGRWKNRFRTTPPNRLTTRRRRRRPGGRPTPIRPQPRRGRGRRKSRRRRDPQRPRRRRAAKAPRNPMPRRRWFSADIRSCPARPGQAAPGTQFHFGGNRFKVALLIRVLIPCLSESLTRWRYRA